jgi:hypothetical protein
VNAFGEINSSFFGVYPNYLHRLVRNLNLPAQAKDK